MRQRHDGCVWCIVSLGQVPHSREGAGGGRPMSRLNDTLRFGVTFSNTLLFLIGLFILAGGAYVIGSTEKRSGPDHGQLRRMFEVWGSGD
jgi:hypothetical protein